MIAHVKFFVKGVNREVDKQSLLEFTFLMDYTGGRETTLRGERDVIRFDQGGVAG